MPMTMLMETVSPLQMVAACFYKDQTMLDVSLLVTYYVVELLHLITLPLFRHYYR